MASSGEYMREQPSVAALSLDGSTSLGSFPLVNSPASGSGESELALTPSMKVPAARSQRNVFARMNELRNTAKVPSFVQQIGQQSKDENDALNPIAAVPTASSTFSSNFNTPVLSRQSSLTEANSDAPNTTMEHAFSAPLPLPASSSPSPPGPPRIFKKATILTTLNVPPCSQIGSSADKLGKLLGQDGGTISRLNRILNNKPQVFSPNNSHYLSILACKPPEHATDAHAHTATHALCSSALTSATTASADGPAHTTTTTATTTTIDPRDIGLHSALARGNTPAYNTDMGENTSVCATALSRVDAAIAGASASWADCSIADMPLEDQLRSATATPTTTHAHTHMGTGQRVLAITTSAATDATSTSAAELSLDQSAGYATNTTYTGVSLNARAEDGHTADDGDVSANMCVGVCASESIAGDLPLGLTQLSLVSDDNSVTDTPAVTPSSGGLPRSLPHSLARGMPLQTASALCSPAANSRGLDARANGLVSATTSPHARSAACVAVPLAVPVSTNVLSRKEAKLTQLLGQELVRHGVLSRVNLKQPSSGAGTGAEEVEVGSMTVHAGSLDISAGANTGMGTGMGVGVDSMHCSHGTSLPDADLFNPRAAASPPCASHTTGLPSGLSASLGRTPHALAALDTPQPHLPANTQAGEESRQLLGLVGTDGSEAIVATINRPPPVFRRASLLAKRQERPQPQTLPSALSHGATRAAAVVHQHQHAAPSSASSSSPANTARLPNSNSAAASASASASVSTDVTLSREEATRALRDWGRGGAVSRDQATKINALLGEQVLL